MLAPGAGDERERAASVDVLVEHGVYSTEGPTGFYFGRGGCRYLLAIDAVTPCST